MSVLPVVDRMTNDVTIRDLNQDTKNIYKIL